MKNLVWLLPFLFCISLSAQRVYPHQFTELTSLTDSNWETYSQKSGLPRRISPANLSAYFLKGVRAYMVGDVLYFSRRDSISSVSLAAYKQTLSVSQNGSGQTQISISGANTITLPATTVGDIIVEAPLEGVGSSGDPIGITAGGIATAKLADNAVTYAKVQAVTSGRILGRYSAGSGTLQEITLGSNLTLSIGGELNSTGGGGSGIAALTGDVTASGTGSVAATIANNAVTTLKILDQAVTLPKLLRSTVISTGSITAAVFKGNGTTALPSFDSVLTYLPSTAISDGVSNGFYKTANSQGYQYWNGEVVYREYHGKIFGTDDGYATKQLTESTGTAYVTQQMAINSLEPTFDFEITKGSNTQGLNFSTVGVELLGAYYNIPLVTSKTTTYQITGKYSSESILSGEVTTTANLPEIVSGTPGSNQVGIGYVLDLSVDKASGVTVSRTGADVLKIDGTPGPVTSIATTGGTFWAKRLRAIDANTWEVIGGGTGSLGVSEYDVSITGGNAGSAVRVVATNTGVTASWASNRLTLVIPNGVRVLSADWRMVSADVQASADAGTVTNWVQVEFQNTGGNTGVGDMRIPSIQKTGIPTTGSLSVSNPATVDIDNAPSIAVVGVGSGNIVIRAGGLSVGAQGYGLKFVMP